MESDICKVVLKESVLNITGIDKSKIQIGIKGDPSLRETIHLRKKYKSQVDLNFDKLLDKFIELLCNRGTYRLYIGFNSGEIRVNSIFDPFKYEIHSAEKIIDDSYFERQFPKIPYDEKMNVINIVYESLKESGVYKYLPSYWGQILQEHNKIKPMSKTVISEIIGSLKALRNMDDYYLRSITICTVQDVISTQFNCDGTQIINSKNYHDFMNGII